MRGEFEFGVKSGGQSFTVTFHLPPVAKVALLSITEEAESTLAIVTRGYTQVYSEYIDVEEEQKMLDQIQRTQLQTPLEFVHTSWLIQNVSRAWTHQAVRTRVGASFVQESLRFADKRSAGVLVSPDIWASAQSRNMYIESSLDAFKTYGDLIEAGVPIQDARGVLPHNVLTNMFAGYSLSALSGIARKRYCCQAQHTGDGEGEWDSVLDQMREQLSPGLRRFVCPPWEVPGMKDCHFGASFDRPCKWPERFQR